MDHRLSRLRHLIDLYATACESKRLVEAIKASHEIDLLIEKIDGSLAGGFVQPTQQAGSSLS